MKTKLLAPGFMAMILSGCIDPSSYKSSPQAQKSNDDAPQPAVRLGNSSPVLKPVVEGKVLSVWEIYRNPFLNKGHVVWLDSTMVMGETLEFNKMLDEHLQLFDIMSYDYSLIEGLPQSRNQKLGELLISTPPHINYMLDTRVPWVVRPEGLCEGWNAFGASVKVPCVHYIGHYKNREEYKWEDY